MSHIDVHEIKLNLRYPNSRQEDITDAFMRGYQGAVKIGNDAVRRVKAEKAALERRIDELCAELSTTQLNCDLWHDRAEDMRNRLSASQAEKAALCTRIDELCQENERLQAAQAHWELGNCPSCPNVVSLQEALEQNAKLREYAAKAWSLFIRHGAIHACDLSEVDAVMDGLRELGVTA